MGDIVWSAQADSDLRRIVPPAIFDAAPGPWIDAIIALVSHWPTEQDRGLIRPSVKGQHIPMQVTLVDRGRKRTITGLRPGHVKPAASVNDQRRVQSGLGSVVVSEHALERIRERAPWCSEMHRDRIIKAFVYGVHHGYDVGCAKGADRHRRVVFSLRGTDGEPVHTSTLIAAMRPFTHGHTVLTVLTEEQFMGNQQRVMSHKAAVATTKIAQVSSIGSSSEKSVNGNGQDAVSAFRHSILSGLEPVGKPWCHIAVTPRIVTAIQDIAPCWRGASQAEITNLVQHLLAKGLHPQTYDSSYAIHIPTQNGPRGCMLTVSTVDGTRAITGIEHRDDDWEPSTEKRRHKDLVWYAHALPEASDPWCRYTTESDVVRPMRHAIPIYLPLPLRHLQRILQCGMMRGSWITPPEEASVAIRCIRIPATYGMATVHVHSHQAHGRHTIIRLDVKDPTSPMQKIMAPC